MQTPFARRSPFCLSIERTAPTWWRLFESAKFDSTQLGNSAVQLYYGRSAVAAVVGSMRHGCASVELQLSLAPTLRRSFIPSAAPKGAHTSAAVRGNPSPPSMRTSLGCLRAGRPLSRSVNSGKAGRGHPNPRRDRLSWTAHSIEFIRSGSLSIGWSPQPAAAFLPLSRLMVAGNDLELAEPPKKRPERPCRFAQPPPTYRACTRPRQGRRPGRPALPNLARCAQKWAGAQACIIVTLLTWHGGPLEKGGPTVASALALYVCAAGARVGAGPWQATLGTLGWGHNGTVPALPISRQFRPGRIDDCREGLYLQTSSLADCPWFIRGPLP
uniref:Uncharacterized protein n=1 Tax=Trichuris muris TaxID=70415 RepID=A0A5S6Q8X0_TRIMR